jgi:hypothetical protein
MGFLQRAWPLAAPLVLGAGTLSGQFLGHRGASDHSPEARRPANDHLVLHVPHLRGSIFLDGDTDDPGWTAPAGPARTGPFVGPNGAPSRPYSDARLVWGDGHLYVVLYAADADIRASTRQADGPLWLDDAFRLLFSRHDVEYAIDVSSAGVLADAVRKRGSGFDYAWSSGAHVSHEQDGTTNDPTDVDEEWLVEMAIPFESLGMRGERGEHIGFAVRRCDAREDAMPVCSGWGEGPLGGEIALD